MEAAAQELETTPPFISFNHSPAPLQNGDEGREFTMINIGELLSLVPSFSGEGTDEMGFTAFLEQINSVAILGQWKDKVKCDIARLKLTKQA
jgi:hypothetical protein